MDAKNVERRVVRFAQGWPEIAKDLCFESRQLCFWKSFVAGEGWRTSWASWISHISKNDRQLLEFWSWHFWMSALLVVFLFWLYIVWNWEDIVLWFSPATRRKIAIHGVVWLQMQLPGIGMDRMESVCIVSTGSPFRVDRSRNQRAMMLILGVPSTFLELFVVFTRDFDVT